jgi:hypothetical protein
VDCSGEDAQCNIGVCDEVGDQCIKDPKTDGTTCDDGLYCNVGETCQSGVCSSGSARDCTIYDKNVNECFYEPDGIDFTYDYYMFDSICNEPADSCTFAPSGWEDDITHTCDIAQCGAECEDNADCVDNSCSETYFDICVGLRLVEYDSDKIKDSTTVDDSCSNSCESACTCTDCGVDCSAPATNTYCVVGECDAVCDEDSDCDDGEAGTNDYCDSGCECVNEPIGICLDDTDCDDGNACNGEETCNIDFICVSGVPVDCSYKDIDKIATCYNNPDKNPFTWDYYGGFISECIDLEEGYECTTGSVTIESTCDIEQCDAECEVNDDCADTPCDSNDGCYDGVYRDYHDVKNVCEECECSSSTCTVFDSYPDDPRCGVVADAGGPYSCDEGESITLDGSGSYSGDGAIVEYLWDLDGDGEYDDATGVSPNYDCEDDYDGLIWLKVIDSNQKKGQGSAELVVNNVNPTASATGPTEGDVGIAVNFQGDGTDVPADELSYKWDFGDGETSNEQNPSHTYTEPDTYSVQLTVFDDDGGQASEKLTIKIYNMAKVPLGSGISMFSLPLVPIGPVAFDDIQVGCELNRGTGKLPLAYHDPTADEYIMIDDDVILYPGQGYFINLNNDCSLKYRGSAFDYDDGRVGFEGSGTLKAGWNMIGAATWKTNYGPVLGNCDLVSGPWGYDYNLPDRYYLTGFLNPGAGYWMKVTSDCSLNGQAKP